MYNLTSSQYGLALHTTSFQLGLIISNFSKEIRSKTWDVEHKLSTYLHQHLVEFVSHKIFEKLAFIAVAKGPGSFTSTRIGVVTARTLAQQLNIPLFGISTLEAFAWQNRDNYSVDSLIPVQMSASRGQLYVAIYKVKDHNQKFIIDLPDMVIDPDIWVQKIQSLKINTKPLIIPKKLGFTVTSILELAYYDWQHGKHPHWSDVIPFYGMSVVN
ncbi:tRNA (adenosine(37)-N6)-threonylcarbamoyltransferase complex dimerization subunit type 1 TsaB [cyanobacterium endosymbiont of Epithemia clementina EcSB]|uniref:tRNA (adenosine(37)-N6)-threonylcarbamoyltransferase complex dimerization subunit type 1 TsaB n=1 Tax=cyanobacterium endosymbiont of Epithemia clementina EcSB TaxID=3034674 RepID=UPI002481850B|nr:tRNA (adenosine(37)-N6)-threonylcarbamoyltransferase complex dimerization subunit type 1 TsaB [cyanobacterium endosymbiont of Epithemia clementina EcSB]WGT67417.1 tRNA (adenosine(37)-N6)-threonylcarbamoyltransferase complex dimerization subunit type 1 TsaB [cyanobacterium endosymbiont of Epithemia clementina EcSB]